VLELARPDTSFRGRAATPKCASSYISLLIYQSSTIDIKLCVGALSTEETAALTKRDKPGKPLDKKDEIVANLIWRFLDVRGLVSPKDIR
jgi:hypothetical protein